MVEPRTTNFDVISGKVYIPERATLAPFVGSRLQTRMHLEHYLWYKVAIYNQVLQGRTYCATECLAALPVEPLRLQWPCSMVRKTLAGSPAVHRARFVATLRVAVRLFKMELRGRFDLCYQIPFDDTCTWSV